MKIATRWRAARAAATALACATLAACGGGGQADDEPSATAPLEASTATAAAPYIESPPRSTRVESGAAARFEVLAHSGEIANNPSLHYQWLKNGTPIEGATAASFLTLPAEADNDGDLYSVTVSSAGGTMASLPARLEVVDRKMALGASSGDRWVDPVHGNDAYPGSDAQPFRSISKAISVVPSGSTVWLKDGTWSPAVDKALFSANPGLNCVAGSSGAPLVKGTAIRAVHDGKVVVVYDSPTALCVGGTTVQGIRFQTAASRIDATSISARLAGARSTLTGVSFAGGTIAVAGGGKLTLQPGQLLDYGPGFNGQGRSAVVQGSGSELAITGGTFILSPIVVTTYGEGDGCFTEAPLMAKASGRLVLTGAQLVSLPDSPGGDHTGTGIATCQGGAVEMADSQLTGTVESYGVRVAVGVRVGTGATLVMTGASKISDYKWGVEVIAAGVDIGAGSSIEDTTTGLSTLNDGATPTTISLRPGSAIRRASGHSLVVLTRTNASIDVRGATLSGTKGIIVYRQGGPMNLCRFRNTRIEAETAAVELETTGNCDFGTRSDPGNNVFAGRTTNLIVHESQVTVMAIGNTWTPLRQGANGLGKYELQLFQTVYELAGPVSGANFDLRQATSRVRVAQL